jgi:TonB-dependent starch-binding outer membrane protein SusC
MRLHVRLLILLIGIPVGVMAHGPVHAQTTGTIEGRVLAAGSGQPLAGVQVSVDGLELGALTGEQGRFTISSVPAGDHTVRAERLGQATETQTVSVQPGETISLEFALADRAVALDELVITGQGSEVSRRRLSTNVDVISEQDLQTSPLSRLDQVLQTGLPSVQVRMSSGQPGAGAQMRGRGPVSASQGSTPVIYVDGVRVDNLNSQAELSMGQATGTQTSAIADIPMENIERVEYIPGGAATTLYGSDAANGVLQIFTSRGTPGPSDFSISTQVGYETPIRDYFHFPETVDLLYRNGLTQQHQISGRGGTSDMTWSFSGSVRDRAGYRIDNNASRSYSGRTGLTAALSDQLRYDGSFSFGWNHYDRARDGNLGAYTPLWLLEGGRIFALGFNNNLSAASQSELNDIRGFLTQAEALMDRRVQVARAQTSHTLRWEPTNELSFRALAGLDHRSSTERVIETNEFLVHTQVHSQGTDDQGTINIYDRDFLGLTLEAGGQHRGDFGPFDVITNAGGQLFREDDTQAQRTALNVRDGSETVRGAGTTNADDIYLTLVNYGAYAQQNWGYRDRYFVELGLRADGNSAFGDDIGFQYYPKLGFVYDMSAEDWFQLGSLSNVLSELRLRANYGVAGNFPPPYTRDRTVSFASYLGQQSVGFGNPGDPELGPEKTHTIEFGGDLEAWDGRFTLRGNWYDARTRDALFAAPSPPSTGEAVQLRNVGEIQNSGIELQLSGEVYRTSDLTVRLRGSFNTLNNEVTDAGGTSVFSITGHSAGTIQSVIEEGQPVGMLRGNKATFAPDGTVESVQAIAHLGSPLPERFGTLGMDVGIRQNLRLNVSADWQTGARMHSFNRQFRYLHGLDDPLVPPAMLEQDRSANWLRMTDQFVEDTDFLKIRNVSVQYTVPSHLAQRVGQSVDLGFSIHNPIGWWSSSFNPEADYSGAQSQGGATVGGFNYAMDPSPRTFMANVRVRF